MFLMKVPPLAFQKSFISSIIDLDSKLDKFLKVIKTFKISNLILNVIFESFIITILESIFFSFDSFNILLKFGNIISIQSNLS